MAAAQRAQLPGAELDNTPGPEAEQYPGHGGRGGTGDDRRKGISVEGQHFNIY